VGANILTNTGIISNTGSLTKAGAGTLILGRVNTYGGTTTVGAGTLQVTNLANAGTSSAIGTNGTIILTNGGTLDYAGTTNTSMNRGINLASGYGGIGVSNSSVALTNTGVISSTGNLVKSGAGTLILSASNSYTGTTTISNGVLVLGNTNALSGSTLDYSSAGRVSFGSLSGANLGGLQGLTNLALTNASGAAVELNVGGNNSSTTYSGILSGGGSLTKSGNGTLTLSGASYSGGTLINAGALAGSTGGLQGNITNNGKLIFDQGTNGSYAGMLSGSGAVNKAGAGDVTFTGDNSYTGSTWIQSGTLNLDAILGAAKNTTSVTVSTGATLLLSQSDQVNNAATVTLSGGTISRGSGVSEVFGNLNLTAASFLDFGTGTAGTMTFGTYTPGSLLTINNFAGNTLVFGSDLSTTITNASYFSFSSGISSTWDSGANTFTITAVPETSTYVATLGLLALCMLPLRRKRAGA